MMKDIKIAQNIVSLRKEKQITQEQLAAAIGVSSQAVSKWERGTCYPDTITVPLIAEYFNVSIDYLYFGGDFTYDDIYGNILNKVSSYPHYCKDSFYAAMKCFASAHHGIAHGCLKSDDIMYDEPSHIGNENGLSLLSGKGFGAIVLKDFFSTIDRDTVDFSISLIKVLAKDNCLLTVAAIVSLSEISLGELSDKTCLSEEELRRALDVLVGAGLVREKESKHKTLGKVYTINHIYHTCICVILSTISMQRLSLKRISCCMKYGDYPIKFDG